MPLKVQARRNEWNRNNSKNKKKRIKIKTKSKNIETQQRTKEFFKLPLIYKRGKKKR